MSRKGKDPLFRYIRRYEDKPQNRDILNHGNPYGYRININHPMIRPYYEYHKKRLNEMILSDAQRLAFEEGFLSWAESRKGD